MTTARKLIIGCALGIVPAAVAVVLDSSGLLDEPEGITWNWRARALAAPGNPDIKLILLDQNSLDWGLKVNAWPWPWPREAYVPIIDFCRRAGAKAIAFDVLFTEPSYLAEDDERLAEAIGRTPGFVSVVLPSAKTEGVTSWPSNAAESPFLVEGIETWANQERGPRTFPRHAVFPIPQITERSRFFGHVGGEIGANQVIRRVYPLLVFDDNAIPMLGLAAYGAGEAAMNANGRPVPPPMQIDPDRLKIGGKRLPLDSHGRTILRFRRPDLQAPHPYPAYTAAAVIESFLLMEEGAKPTIDPQTFRDAYVFFGFSAPALYDLKPTPFSPAAPGVIAHATLLDNLLAQDAIDDAPWWLVAAFTFASAMGGAVASLLSRTARGVVIGLAAFLPMPAAAGFVAYAAGYWWPIVAPQGAVLAAIVAGVIVNYATEGRQRRFLRQAFGQYLSREVIERMLTDPSTLNLGGEERVLTIFFSDIEKFSTFSHEMDAATLTSLLNDYLTEMTGIVFDEGGTLDKYIGDAIVAFWNAPTEQPDHAQRAVRAAIRCQRRIAERQPDYSRRIGGRPFRVRIGVHTGPVAVGNMGSATRFAYTVLGDTANLASRLEGANKAFGTYTMVSEETWRHTDGQFLGRRIATLTVVGRRAPVTVYEPLGFAGEPQDLSAQACERAVQLCREGRAGEALHQFEELPDDPVARAYLRHISDMAEEDRPRWDGVWNLMEK